ncbi:MAG: hypothetical protein ACRCXT_10010, partial [Paraclostridium sp.]
MIERFDINGATIEFSPEKVRYNNIRKEFSKQAKYFECKFKEECTNKYTSRELQDISLTLGEEYIQECIKKAVETIVNYKVITIDIYLFKKNYCKKYLNHDKKFKDVIKENLNSNKHKKISLAQKSIEDKKF